MYHPPLFIWKIVNSSTPISGPVRSDSGGQRNMLGTAANHVIEQPCRSCVSTSLVLRRPLDIMRVLLDMASERNTNSSSGRQYLHPSSPHNATHAASDHQQWPLSALTEHLALKLRSCSGELACEYQALLFIPECSFCDYQAYEEPNLSRDQGSEPCIYGRKITPETSLKSTHQT